MGKDNKSRKCNGLLKLYSLKILTYIGIILQTNEIQKISKLSV